MEDFEALRGKHLLITGGAGMLGSTIAHLALPFGARITVVDAMLPLYGGNLVNLPPASPEFTFIEGDIRDSALMRRVVESTDCVFNLAGQVSYMDGDADPFLDLDINGRGQLSVLEACRQASVRPKVVFASSRFVYGRTDYTPVDEDHPFNCLSIYGIHKLAGEKYHRFYCEAYGVPTVVLRIPNPYGPRQQMRHSRYGIANWFIRMAFDGQPLTVYGDGNQVRDYIYVEDVARAFLAVAVSEETNGQTYNVGTGNGTSLRTMAELIAAEMPGTRVTSVAWPPKRWFVETGDYVADITRLSTATGWKPTVSLQEGIRRTIAYYRGLRRFYW